MQIFSRHLPTLMIGVVLGAFIAVTSGVLANRDEPEASKIPFEDLRTFTEVLQRIKSDYVEEVDDKTLLENAIKGMLGGLDPHSGYLNADAYGELQLGTSGEFGGLGIEVGMENGFVRVISPIDDTPAQRAGVQAGDMIIRLDDTPVKGMTLMEAVKIMRGKPGTDIMLTIVRENQDKPLKIEITRDIIKLQSVKNRTLEPGYGYVRISHFQAHTGEHLHRALDELHSENANDLKGIVLDLRNNPGGVLNAAVSVADTFLENGLIVYTEGRVQDSDLRFAARPNDRLNGIPIVVLVNPGSASASEIVAGALQDHKRAIIMGSKTFGKGSVQTIMPMNNSGALKLTTARYYTPSGRSIQAEGIEPDIILDKVRVTSLEESEEFGVREANLARHLENDAMTEEGVNAEDNAKGSAKEDEAEKQPLAQTDYELYEALNLLKGLSILNAGS